ncbi:MAG: LytTR family DNA-binding domain-containing protein [Bacteroidota bacterium]
MELSDIHYAEGNGNYVVFVAGNKKIVSRLTMSEAEALLPATDFIRVHRSYIVSKRHVQKMDKRSIWIQQTEIPIGSAYAVEIEKLIK